MISGADIGILIEAIKRSFTPVSFEMMLTIRLEKSLANEAPAAAFPYQVFKVLENARMEGWEMQLLLALIAERPKVPEFQTVYARYVNCVYTNTPESCVTLDHLQALVNAQTPLHVRGLAEFLSTTPRHVCRIEVRLDGGASTWGTGFLISKDLVMSNYHVFRRVIDGSADPAKVVCKFDYAVTPDGLDIDQGIDVGLDANPVITYSELCPFDTQGTDSVDVAWPDDKLDYAIVRLNKPIGDLPFGINSTRAEHVSQEKRGWIKSPQPGVELGAGGTLFIFQHPAAGPLQVGLGQNKIIGTDANKRRVRYDINTSRGSSGSPAFNEKYLWVALHNMGDPSWVAAYNQGIPAIRIIEDLQKKHITL